MKLQWILGIVATACCTMAGKAQQKDISGTWLGTLILKEQKLRIVIHLKNNNGVYSGSFDSPDEKKVKVNAAPGDLTANLPDSVTATIKNIPFDSVIIKKGILSLFGFQLPQPLYVGVMETDSTLKGRWGVAPDTFRLDMKRVHSKWELGYVPASVRHIKWAQWRVFDVMNNNVTGLNHFFSLNQWSNKNPAPGSVDIRMVLQCFLPVLPALPQERTDRRNTTAS
ncbi:hypothetical protein [Niabella beijingensis]|uniref:hypothetical protein n=1 Tax=Niabella beijingensis TaxID=2872700 RepID=UPI001CBEF588|nr:hypothetical protein [Niabella beijingensis]MBZ4189381.1 hypothetical protein [Niabella beijingensis]